MIPFHFDYYRPDSLAEAVSVYKELQKQNKNPLYYGGGSEIITMSRVCSISPSAVIDIKAIPECGRLEFERDKLVIGSAVTLSKIAETHWFPLMGTVVKRIADHTNQCRITLGGNVCGTIYYREAVLPLLLTDCDVVVQTLTGLRTLPLRKVFDGRLKLKKGEFAVQFIIDREYLFLPYYHIKKTRNEKIDYPLVTVALLKKEGMQLYLL